MQNCLSGCGGNTGDGHLVFLFGAAILRRHHVCKLCVVFQLGRLYGNGGKFRRFNVRRHLIEQRRIRNADRHLSGRLIDLRLLMPNLKAEHLAFLRLHCRDRYQIFRGKPAEAIVSDADFARR